jgi:hypothetical protein
MARDILGGAYFTGRDGIAIHYNQNLQTTQDIFNLSNSLSSAIGRTEAMQAEMLDFQRYSERVLGESYQGLTGFS